MILRVFWASKLRILNGESSLNNSINNASLSSIKGKYLYNYTLKKKGVGGGEICSIHYGTRNLYLLNGQR